MKKTISFCIIAIFICLVILLGGCTSKATTDVNGLATVKASTNPVGITADSTIGSSNMVILQRSVTVDTTVKNLGSFSTQDMIYVDTHACAALTSTNQNGNNYIKKQLMGTDIPEKNDQTETVIDLPGLTASTVNSNCPIITDLCYTYETQLVQKLHFSDSPITYTSGKDIQQQGSPLNVVAIYQDYYIDATNTKNLQFQIFVENKGGGLIENKDKYSTRCDTVVSAADAQNIDNYYNAKVYLGGIDGIQLVCSSDYANGGVGSGTGQTPAQYRLSYVNGQPANQDNYFFCTFPSAMATADLFSSNSNAERYITIVLDYGYYKKTEKDIQIQSSSVVIS